MHQLTTFQLGLNASIAGPNSSLRGAIWATTVLCCICLVVDLMPDKKIPGGCQRDSQVAYQYYADIIIAQQWKTLHSHKETDWQ
jgi:hypothetical protein